MYRHFFKPLFDFTFAIVALPFLCLLIIPIAVAVKCEDGGRVFYCGERIGKNGKPFKMIKFRSMKEHAPDIRLADGSTYNGKDDSRVTKVGAFLRKTSLDEIPQIFNILAFQMSLIGPRPDTTDWLERYRDDEKSFLSVRPGITGYSQAYFRNSIDSDFKIKNDNYYAENLTFAMDVKVFFKTIATVLKRENVYIDEARADAEALKPDVPTGDDVPSEPNAPTADGLPRDGDIGPKDDATSDDKENRNA